MARPNKRTVDYFPHIVNDGKVRKLIVNRFAIEGYYCYYKLQERLADSHNHYIDLRDDLDYEYFIGEINISEEIINPIIDYLCKLNYFDKELWKNKILWSDEFVENIADAYSKRLGDIPQKPSLDDNNNIINIVPEVINPVNVTSNTQRKGKEIKENNNYNKKKYLTTDFKFDTTGKFQIGYCNKCSNSGFYEKFALWGDSKCCNAEITPKRKEFINEQ